MMKMYHCKSRVTGETYIIRAESEWQARDIADHEDHLYRVDIALSDGEDNPQPDF